MKNLIGLILVGICSLYVYIIFFAGEPNFVMPETENMSYFYEERDRIKFKETLDRYKVPYRIDEYGRIVYPTSVESLFQRASADYLNARSRQVSLSNRKHADAFKELVHSHGVILEEYDDGRRVQFFWAAEDDKAVQELIATFMGR